MFEGLTKKLGQKTKKQNIPPSARDKRLAYVKPSICPTKSAYGPPGLLCDV
jgi:hypothetical protein